MKGVHVVINPIFKSILITVEGSTHSSPIDNKVKSGDEDNNENGWDAMTPDVDTFIMDHEEASNDPPWSVEVDPISISNMLVVSHELGSSLVVSNVLLIMLRMLNKRLFFFFLFLFLLLLSHLN